MKNYKNIVKSSFALLFIFVFPMFPMFPMAFNLMAQDTNEKEATKSSEANPEPQDTQTPVASTPAPTGPAPEPQSAEKPKEAGIQAAPSQSPELSPQTPVSGAKKPLQTETETSKTTEQRKPQAAQNPVSPSVPASSAKASSGRVSSNRASSNRVSSNRWNNEWDRHSFHHNHRGGFFRFMPLFGKSKMSFKIPELSLEGRPAQRNQILLNDIVGTRNSNAEGGNVQTLDYAGSVFGFEMLLGASPIDNIAFHGGIFYLNSSTLTKQTPCCSPGAVGINNYDYQYSFGGFALGATSYSMPANFYFTFQGRVVTNGKFNVIRPNPAYDPDLPDYADNYQYSLEEKYVLESGNDLGYSIAFGWEGKFANNELRFVNLGIAFQYARDVLRLANYAAAADLEGEHSYYGLALSLTFF